MQNIIVGIVVVIAAVYILRRFYSSMKQTQTNTCGCKCESCPEATSTCGQASKLERKLTIM